MTLDKGVIKKTYEIQAILLPPGIEKRLEALGMIRGASITILNCKGEGTMIVRVRGTRFALGKGITKNICVKE